MSMARLEPLPHHRKLYAVTSVARPVDIRYPTNRAVAIMIPFALLGGILFHWLGDAEIVDALWFGVRVALALFGTWALTRELLIDDQRTAFLAAAGSIPVMVVGREISVLLLFSTLFLVRVVNRSVGPPAKLTDLAAACGIALYATHDTLNIFFWLGAFVAFLLNALLRPRAHISWVFAALSVGGGAYYISDNIPLLRELGFLTFPDWAWILIPTVVLFIVAVFLTRQPTSTSDVDGSPISTGRVRGGMMVAWLCAVLPLFGGNIGLYTASLVWVCLGAVATMGLVGRFVWARPQRRA